MRRCCGATGGRRRTCPEPQRGATPPASKLWPPRPFPMPTPDRGSMCAQGFDPLCQFLARSRSSCSTGTCELGALPENRGSVASASRVDPLSRGCRTTWDAVLMMAVSPSEGAARSAALDAGALRRGTRSGASRRTPKGSRMVSRGSRMISRPVPRARTRTHISICAWSVWDTGYGRVPVPAHVCCGAS